MNDNNISHDSLDELRAGMEALKGSLPPTGIISEADIRSSMAKKSSWLNKVVLAEAITLPIVLLILLAATLVLGMNVWCLIVIVVLAVPDLLLDMRTMRVSRKWIYEEPLTGLMRRLARQKVERQYQTVAGVALAVPWMIWFTYEYVSHVIPGISDESFWLVFGILSVCEFIAVAIVIIWLYRKAQRINDSMISDLHAAVGEE